MVREDTFSHLRTDYVSESFINLSNHWLEPPLIMFFHPDMIILVYLFVSGTRKAHCVALAAVVPV